MKRKCGVRSAECGIKKVVMILWILCIYFIYPGRDISYAEVKGEGEKKIELEKTEIFGVLEHPATIFPVRWKDPEVPDEKTYTLKRSFKREILEFVDVFTPSLTLPPRGGGMGGGDKR